MHESDLIQVGIDVAVLPNRLASPADVVEISTVTHCGEVCILLANGRQFATAGLVGLGDSRHYRIQPASEPFRRALAKKQSRTHRIA